MHMKERIELALAPLAPVMMSVEDRSADHHGHGGWREGGETHFDVVIVSDAFRGQNRVSRHRTVNSLVQDLLDGGIHALALKTLTPEEAGDLITRTNASN